MHESLYGYQNTTSNAIGAIEPSPRIALPDIDADLALALRISEQEQQQLQDELRREEEMIAEAMRLSLEESANCSKPVVNQQGS